MSQLSPEENDLEDVSEAAINNKTPKSENETLKPSNCRSFFPAVDLPLQILENFNQRNKL
jgi:hypothetical protein